MTLRRILQLFLSFIFLSSTLTAGKNRSLAEQLSFDVRHGNISQVQALKYELMSITHPADLPEHYKDIRASYTRKGTFLKAKLKYLWPELSNAAKIELQIYLARPSRQKLDQSLTSPSGRFKIHYTLEGNDATNLAFVTRAAEIFDEVYEFQVNDLGYPPPPLDFGVDGPEYDVYMYNYGDYGATTAERPVPETGWDDYTSWIEIDNDFQHTYTNGEDALKVTAAHEFFHMIQIGYRSYHLTSKLNSIFLYEACAAWMEDVVYDEINDYYQYLDNFYSNPDEPFHLFDGEHEYGLSVFFHMLEQKYDLDIVKAIWSEFKDHDVLTAIENAVQSYQTTFSKELADFTVWNCFTGKNAEHFSYYEEAKNYPEIKANEELDLFEKVSIRDSCKELVAKYYKLQPQAFGNYVFKPAFEEPHNWLSSVIINSLPGGPYVATCGGNKDQSLNNLEASSSVWLAIMNSKKPQKDISYEFQTLDIRIERGTLANARSEITAAVPSPFIIGEHPAVEFQYTLKESYQNATVYILSENGVTVKQEYLNWMPSGMGKWVWDGRNDNGEYVSSGIYLFQIITDQVTGPFKFALIR